jgi:uncharacterized protein (DUF58 family)
MIVPERRLLQVAGFAFLPLVTAGVALGSPVALAVAAAVAAAACADAALAFRGLAGVDAQLPARVRLAEGRRGTIELRILRCADGPRRLRVALAWPRELAPEDEERVVALPDAGEAAVPAWRCLPARRGRYRIASARVERTSPLGLWAARRTLPLSGEVQVFPGLREERRELAYLFLRGSAAGMHRRRQLGKGREFDKLREYAPGDDYGDIHWKATARRGVPVTKVFQVERTQPVYCIVDASRLSARPAAGDGEGAGGAGDVPPRLVLDRFVDAAMVLALAAGRQGDQFGLVVFDDRVRQFLKAGSGKAHQAACLDAVHDARPRQVSPDFGELAAQVRLRVRRRALLLVLTSVDDPVLAEELVRAVAALRRQHLVLVAAPVPAGARPLFEDPEIDAEEQIAERLGGHLRWHGLRELEKVLQRDGASLARLDPARFSTQLVARYFDIKRRQLL